MPKAKKTLPQRVVTWIEHRNMFPTTNYLSLVLRSNEITDVDLLKVHDNSKAKFDSLFYLFLILLLRDKVNTLQSVSRLFVWMLCRSTQNKCDRLLRQNKQRSRLTFLLRYECRLLMTAVNAFYDRSRRIFALKWIKSFGIKLNARIWKKNTCFFCLLELK